MKFLVFDDSTIKRTLNCIIIMATEQKNLTELHEWIIDEMGKFLENIVSYLNVGNASDQQIPLFVSFGCQVITNSDEKFNELAKSNFEKYALDKKKLPEFIKVCTDFRILVNNKLKSDECVLDLSSDRCIIHFKDDDSFGKILFSF